MPRVPDSSSPPSTPASDRIRAPPRFVTGLSTTPAGKPPNSSFTNLSTTPAGPPPSSQFGSSTFNASVPISSRNAFSSQQASKNPLRTLGLGMENSEEEVVNAMEEDQEMLSSHGKDFQPVEDIEHSNISAVAKSMARTLSELHESDDFITDTEYVVESLQSFIRKNQGYEDKTSTALAVASRDLIVLWEGYQDFKRLDFGIGPGGSASPNTKALFLASLLMFLHHPPPREGVAYYRENHSTPIPEVLLNWLKAYHNPYPADFEDVLQFEPNACAHERFWDVVLSLTCRGRIKEAIQLLKEADFTKATSAVQDGAGEPGYHGKRLGNVQRVVARAVQVLEACPAVHDNDWDVRNGDWKIYRKRVTQALSDLETFAEGSGLDQTAAGHEHFKAENFGMSGVRSDDLSVSRQSRKAESKVPWSVYQNLQYLYSQLLGTRSEVIAAAADWVEAAICMTVWWSGDEDEAMQENLQASRRSSFGRSKSVRLVDVDPRVAYQRQLASSLQRLAREQDVELQVNPMSPVEVGLACIFEDDVEGVFGILRGWSTAMSAALAEIAGLGRWLNISARPTAATLDAFDEEDLMVLSHQQQLSRPVGVSRDSVLIHYAQLLSRRGMLVNSRTNEQIDGWQLATQILGRLESTDLANSKIAAVLDNVDLAADGEVEKVVGLCCRLGLTNQSRKTSERYADYLTETSLNYGGAVYYYARAHAVQKLRDVLNVLVSFCLVQSRAYPPTAELDATLQSLTTQPKQTLAKLDLLDREAASMLSTYFSGYATLRKFYDLRDQKVNLQPGEKPELKPIARRKEAAKALIAAITSAADSIHGGLYDDSIDSVMQVDGLLVLLGESLMFVNQPKRVLNVPQNFALLKAIEDLTTVSSSIFSQCEECLNSTLAEYHDGSQGSTPSKRMTKSTILSMSQFSLVGSAMLGSHNMRSQSSLDGTGVLVKGGDGKIRRGWDWRKGLRKGATGEDVMKILRLGLAKDIARAWTEDTE